MPEYSVCVQSVTSRSREFCSFLDGTGTGTGEIWSRKKSTGIGTGKNSGYRHTLQGCGCGCVPVDWRPKYNHNYV